MVCGGGREFEGAPVGTINYFYLQYIRPALGDIRKRRAVYRYTTVYCTLCTLLQSTALYCKWYSTALNNTYTALRFLIAQGRPYILKE
jgi:hypothetical protein